MRGALLATLLAACTLQPDKDTFADISIEMGHALCTRHLDCGFTDSIDSCTDHQIYHLCVLDGTCRDEVYEADWSLLDQCVVAIYASGCWDVRHYWPYPCQRLLTQIKG